MFTDTTWINWIIALGIPSLVGVIVANFFDLRRERQHLKFQRDIAEERMTFDKEQAELQRKHEQASMEFQQTLSLRGFVALEEQNRKSQWLSLQYDSLHYVIENMRKVSDLSDAMIAVHAPPPVEFLDEDGNVEYDRERVRETKEKEDVYRNEALATLGKLESALTVLGDMIMVPPAREAIQAGRELIESSRQGGASAHNKRVEFDKAFSEFNRLAAVSVDDVLRELSLDR